MSLAFKNDFACSKYYIDDLIVDKTANISSKVFNAYTNRVGERDTPYIALWYEMTSCPDHQTA